MELVFVRHGRPVHIEDADGAADPDLAEVGHDPVYGARPLRRYLQHELETRIGRALIAGDVSDGDEVYVDVEAENLQVEIRRPAPNSEPREEQAVS